MKPRFILLGIVLPVLAWVLLEPWRPIFSGDDWGFYESVMLTIANGRVVVSDWLEPSAVGLTIPATLLTLITGNFWTACMFVTGILGVLGVVSITRILRYSNLSDANVAVATFVIAFFPIFLEKWARFESPVPALSLSLASIAALIAHVRRVHPDQYLYLFIAAICVAWAILIRQNHLALLVAGCLFLYANSPSKKLSTIGLWILPSLVALVLYFSFVERGFAARVTMRLLVVNTVTHLGFIGSFLTMAFFSFGTSSCLLLIADPFRALQQVRAYSKGMVMAAVITLCSMILLTLLSNKTIAWLAPTTSIPHLFLVWPYPLAVLVLFGSIAWPLFLPREWRTMLRNFPDVLLPLALLYVAGSSIRGGNWEIYALEAIVLLVLYAYGSWPAPDPQSMASLNPKKSIGVLLVGLGIGCWTVSLVADWLQQKPFNPGSQQTAAFILGTVLLFVGILVLQKQVRFLFRLMKAMPPAVLAAYILISWYVERVEVDSQVNRLQIVEQAFRLDLAEPGNVNAPFGLVGWNTMQQQIERWRTNPIGDSLAVWDFWNPKPAVQLRIYDGNVKSALVQGESVLRSGKIRLGFKKRDWILVKANTAEVPIMTLPHRQLPLTSTEWHDWLQANSN